MTLSRPAKESLCVIVAASLILSGCQPIKVNNLRDRIRPSNERPWSPELTVLPSADFDGQRIHIRNIRNVNYMSESDFVVKHYDRTIELDEVQSVDFVVTPFQRAPMLAHTMLSFGLADGSYLGVSVEVRNEQGEEYSPLLGLSRQFEIIYVIADERDLIRLRTQHRDADVYIYPSVATPRQAQRLLVDVLQRVNRLKDQPEFYHTLRNNCTTNLVQHVNQLKPNRIAYHWRLLLPGFSARHAYDLGLLDNRIPFDDLKALAYVNDLANESYDDPSFSQVIRSRRKTIDRITAQQRQRESSITAGGQYLDRTFEPRRGLWR